MTKPLPCILVTTDLSPLGDAAVPLAFRFAAAEGAKVLLLSVVERPSTPSPLYAHYYPVPGREQVEQARKELHAKLAQRVPPEAASVPHELLVADGDPVQEIARVAVERAPRLLVIATHGRTGLKHFLLGSVAERVLRTTSCPVLLVR